LDFVEVEAGLTLPIIPATANEDFFRPGDFLGLEAEAMRLALESGGILKHLSKLLDIVPFRPPVLSFRKGK
jgi:hypothetical protein